MSVLTWNFLRFNKFKVISDVSCRAIVLYYFEILSEMRLVWYYILLRTLDLLRGIYLIYKY